jgi:hypothetical protein
MGDFFSSRTMVQENGSKQRFRAQSGAHAIVFASNT